MPSMQCNIQFSALRSSVSVHSSKNTRTRDIFKILIVLFSKMVLNFACINFAQSSFFFLLNFANFLKSRNLILAKISKNNVQTTTDNSNLQGKSKKVRVIGSSKKIAVSKVKKKNSFYCTVNILITFNC